MFKIVRKEFQFGRDTVVLETGRIARQATGAVMVTIGETAVLVTVVGKKEADPSKGFFPLTVNYQEKTYAAGRIPGGFFKREGRPSEKETLTSRLIDRPIRPLFPEGFMNEVQVIATVMSASKDADPDIASMIGTSAALAISGIPFNGPIGAARVGFIDDMYVLNPTYTELKTSALDLVVAGTEKAVLMVESEAKELSEDQMLGAVMFAHDAIRPVVNAIIDLAEKAAKDPWDVASQDGNADMKASIKAMIGDDIAKAYKTTSKSDRSDMLNAARDKVKAHYAADTFDGQQRMTAIKLTKKIEADIVRGAILAVPRGQAEAGAAYALSRGQVLWRIVLPQMVRHAIPGFANNWLVMLKASALVSIIGLDDMVNRAGLAAASTREPFTFYMAVAVIYLLLTTVSIFLLSRLEARFSLGVRKAVF